MAQGTSGSHRKPRTPRRSSSRSRKAGRPVSPLLNKELIADVALDIITREGLDSLTMKHLAEELAVAPSALYNHIPSKAGLMLIVQDAVMSQVDTADMEQLAQRAGASRAQRERDLREALETWSWSYRDMFVQCAELVPMIATMPISGAPATQAMYNAVGSGLEAAGIPTAKVVPIIVAFESFIYGSAMDLAAPETIFALGPEEDDAAHFSAQVEAFTRSQRSQEERQLQRRGGEEAGQRGGRGGTAAVPAVPANPYADEPFRWGLAGLIEQTTRLIDR